MSRNCSGAISAVLVAGLLSACSGGEIPEEPDFRLGALGAPDIEKHEIYGTVCGFRAAGGSIQALALIQPDKAWIKIGPEATPLPLSEDAEAGEEKGPLGIGLVYGNEAAVLTLTPSGEERASGGGRLEMESGLTLQTSENQLVELDGILQCSSGSI